MALDSSLAFIPHGYCLSWSPGLVGLIAGSHLLIGVSYLSIPVALFVFARRHPELNQRLLFALFSLFILGCGGTHLIELANIWVPFYRLDSVVLAITAMVSVVTAILIWPITRHASVALSAVFLARREQSSTNGQLTETVRQLKLANARLDESERRYRLIVEHAPNGQCTVALDGHFLSVNQSLTRMLGYSEAELLGKTFQDITHPDDLQRDLQHVQDLLQGRADSYRMQKRYFQKSGQVLHVQLDVALLRSPAGQPMHFIVQIQDITARIRAEQAEEQAERRFRRMIESVTDYSIINLDANGCVASWNDGARRIKGYHAHEIVGKYLSCFYPQDDYPVEKAARILRIAQQEGRFKEEGWRVRKDGSRFWASVVLTAIHDNDGSLIGYSKITRDLTERRKSEEVLASANSLREAIMEAAPYSIIATDADGLITSFNPAAERMLWYTAGDLVGKKSLSVFHEKNEIADRAQELSAKYRTSVAPGFEVLVHESRKGLIEEHEWTYVRKDGSRFPVQLAVTALRDAGKNIIGFLGIAHDITQRKRREEYTRHISLHDELTGLPNRTLLKDRLNVALEGAKRNGKKVGVMMLDLDHFKRVNDTLGHHVGDELLKVVSERIVKNLRRSDTAARMGGDEFVIVTPDLAQRENSELIASALVKAISAPVQIGTHQLTVTPSIGVSCYPEDGQEVGALIKNADAAMYQAKAAGRAGYQHFNADAQAVIERNLAIENDLRKAIAEERLQVHYQPQICLRTGQITGVEALARWEDPERGLVPPELFIPLAEETGLIIGLGDFVLRAACRDAAQLQKRAGHPLVIAVNLSARQLRRDDLIEHVQNVLRETGMDPRQLELEITEGVMMENREKARLQMQGLRDLGVLLAVDDFGTGYSSLSYLAEFPITTLKIDRSFVSRFKDSERDAAVVQSVMALSKSLSIRVVAEGVESLEQLKSLQEYGVDIGRRPVPGLPAGLDQFIAQGYLFSKPVSVGDLENAFHQIQADSMATVRSSLPAGMSPVAVVEAPLRHESFRGAIHCGAFDQCAAPGRDCRGLDQDADTCKNQSVNDETESAGSR